MLTLRICIEPASLLWFVPDDIMYITADYTLILPIRSFVHPINFCTKIGSSKDNIPCLASHVKPKRKENKFPHPHINKAL